MESSPSEYVVQFLLAFLLLETAGLYFYQPWYVKLLSLRYYGIALCTRSYFSSFVTSDGGTETWNSARQTEHFGWAFLLMQEYLRVIAVPNFSTLLDILAKNPRFKPCVSGSS